MKKQKNDFQVCFVTEQVIEKIVEDKDSQNTKRSTKVAKELFADYVKEKKLRKLEEKKESAQTLKIYILCQSEKERIRSVYSKTIIRFGFRDIQNNQGLSKGYQPQPSASAANLYLGLDHSGYQKNLIQSLFNIGGLPNMGFNRSMEKPFIAISFIVTFFFFFIILFLFMIKMPPPAPTPQKND